MLVILGVRIPGSSRPTRLGYGPIRDDFPKETGPQGTTLKIVLWSPQAHIRAVPHTYTFTTPPLHRTEHTNMHRHTWPLAVLFWNRNNGELHVNPIR